jgi:hypothetical protein
MPEHYLAFQVKYLGPTNYRGARVKLICSRLDWQKTISYDYNFNRADSIAENWLQSNGAKIVGFAEIAEKTVFFVDWESGLEAIRQGQNFEPIKVTG